MLRTIIVGVDGRPAGDDAVALARGLSALDDADLVVVCSYPARTMHGPRVGSDPVVLERDAVRALNRARSHLGAAENVEHLAVFGTTPALTLKQLAAERRADLVVIGSPERSRLGRVLGGDVLTQLLDAPTHPVAIAPRGYAAAPPHRIARVGVAFDGTREAEAALRFTGALATVGEEPVGVVQVIHVSAPQLERHADGTPVRSAAEHHAHVGRLLERAVRELPAELVVEQVEAYGAAPETLAGLSAELDLLVTGSHGRGPLGRLLHGSVVSDVAANAHCPVVAVPLIEQHAVH